MLTSLQHRAAALMGCGHNVTETARMIARHRSTVVRWGRIQEFREAVKQTQNDLRSRILETNVGKK